MNLDPPHFAHGCWFPSISADEIFFEFSQIKRAILSNPFSTVSQFIPNPGSVHPGSVHPAKLTQTSLILLTNSGTHPVFCLFVCF